MTPLERPPGCTIRGEDKIEKAVEHTWFEEEVMRLLPDLLSGALRMADSRAEAEDVVGEAIARAWEHRGDLRDRELFRGWLFRIMRNTYLGRRRKREVRPEEIPLPGEGEDEPSFSIFERLHQPFLLWWGNPEEKFFDRLLEEDLRRAVDSLPEIYRTAVVLADVHGFTYAEIAEILEIPVGTVRSRLSRGRSRLQEHLWSHAVDAGFRKPRPDGNADGADDRAGRTSPTGSPDETKSENEGISE